MIRSGSALLLALLGMHAGGETLHYTINWQSGLSLGEASLRSEHLSAASEGGEAGGWKFEMMLDAAVPGFTIRDEYSSTADNNFCSLLLRKTVVRGARKTVEETRIDPRTNTATRETLGGGGRSQLAVPECVHDAMAFVQFVRHELAQGRMAPQQPVLLGAIYEVQLTYTGTETLRVAGAPVVADRVHVAINGPKADATADLYFAHDDARTPVFARIPLPLGVFTVELLP
jgi:hypothetical protein